MNFYRVSGLLLILLVLAGSGATAVAAEAPALEVWLVRHAEKQLSTEDPQLTPAGFERAERLSTLLRDARIEAIHSTDYRRTLQTAAPLATRLGLEIDSYDPRNLEGLVERLMREGGRHLVVGHSNTTPQAVRLLGGEPGAAIDEASEYDRLYLVILVPGESSRTIVLRY